MIQQIRPIPHLLPLVFGLLGGIVGAQLGSPVTAVAEDTPAHQTVIRAGRFELVDSSGRTRARLSLESPVATTGSRAAEAEAEAVLLLDGLSPEIVRERVARATEFVALTMWDSQGKERTVVPEGLVVLKSPPAKDGSIEETTLGGERPPDVRTVTSSKELRVALTVTADGASKAGIEKQERLPATTPNTDTTQSAVNIPKHLLTWVKGGTVLWTDQNQGTSPRPFYDGTYSFSVHNGLDRAIRHVLCRVVFYDAAGQAVETDMVQYSGTIPAGLAQRVTGRVDASVYELTTAGQMFLGSQPTTRIEVTVTDFEWAE
jgi:hypothetical protein